jgi:hypothetical protein
VEHSGQQPVYHLVKISFIAAMLPITLGLPSGLSAADGLFLGESLEKASASIEGSEMVLRLPITQVVAPKARGILLFDSVPGLRLISQDGGLVLAEETPARSARHTIYVVLNDPPTAKGSPRLVLDGTVFWDVKSGERSGYRESHWMSFDVTSEQQPTVVLRRAGVIFGVPDEQLHDLRLTAAQQTQKPEGDPDLAQSEIDEIRQTTYLMGRRQILESLLDADPAQWRELVSQWPGRHPLTISATETQAAVYYAPNRGYQFAKREGKWTIVGG